MYDFLKYCKGVILVGAANGHERNIFNELKLDAIYIEARPDVISHHIPKSQQYNYLITDVDDQEYDFHVSSNKGLSSSVFDFKDHKKIWEKIKMVKTIKMKSITLDTMFLRHNLDVKKFDAMICDVQGGELLVLKGATNVLKNMKFVLLEAADFEAYQGCCQIKDIEPWMLEHGFKERMRRLQVDKPGVGKYFDVLYYRINNAQTN
jgi:FkbM family methyltransferase